MVGSIGTGTFSEDLDMRRLLRRTLTALALLACLVVVGSVVLACSVPVFRYALERWPADAYGIVIVHDGPLAEKDKALVEWLGKAAEAGGPAPSFVVKTIDRAAKGEEAPEKLPPTIAPESLPWVTVFYPRSARNATPVWAGPLNGQDLKTLVESPARRQIAKRLTEGDSAVWVLLESGDKKKDDKAAALLTSELKKMEEALKLPTLTADPADRLAVAEEDLPLQVGFSLLRVSRADEAERMFVRMLIHTEEDLAELKDPMAFAVFGRGRALWALVGPGINVANIQESCAFLVGPCSCQIKTMCPGTDMLMVVDWDAMLMGEAKSLPELASLPEVVVPVPATVVAPEPLPSPEAAEPARVPGALVRNVAIAVAVGLAFIVIAGLVIARRSRG